MTKPLVIFVCTGNICRSPMAQAIAADLAQRQGRAMRFASAGTAAYPGNAAMEFACDALEEIGLQLDEHRARPIDPRMLARADLVVAVTGRHRDQLRAAMPAAADRIRSFAELTGLGDLADPIGGELDAYRRVRDLLVDGMPRVLAAVQVGSEPSEN